MAVHELHYSLNIGIAVRGKRYMYLEDAEAIRFYVWVVSMGEGCTHSHTHTQRERERQTSFEASTGMTA